MLAIIKDNKIEKTANNIRQLFPNTSFPSSGADAEWKAAEGVKDVVQGEQKDQRYYFVTQGDITLVDGVPTQQYTSTAKRLADEDAKDTDGNQVYNQVWSDSANDGSGGYVDSSEKVINQGLKSIMTTEVKDTANNLLAQTDWMVIRKYERDVAIPSGTATYRAAVITECARLEGAISSASDVDALKTVMQGQNWPTED